MEHPELNKMDEKPPQSTLRNSSVWPSVKPFVNGGLSRVLPLGISFYFAFLHYKLGIFPHIWLNISQRMQFTLFRGGINAAILLGSYELLTRKVEALNEGSPLTLYQEAGCGIISGAIRACICYPPAGRVATGIAQAGTNKYSFRHAFSTIRQVVRNEGVLALWRGASPVIIPAAIASNTGMVVSYDRSRIYLKEAYGLRENKARYGLRENEARYGAGIISGLCSGACYTSVLYAAAFIRAVKFSHSLSYALGALKPGGRFNFFSELWKECVRKSPGIMLMWVLLEAIRDAEESAAL